MRLSRYFAPTLRENPSDAEIVSHKLMMRAGMIRKVAAGIYSYLPLGLRVIYKVEDIVRKYMNEAGAVELLMPAITPAELWQESGRWAHYGPELLRLQDRHNRDFCVGPTHEEVITDIVRNEIKSYKQLPLNLYQIQTKFRDEVRPRFGLMRGREFIMKDAYSFDVDDEGANKSYELMRDAYCKIFSACGLKYKAVDADSGAIGGSYSHEFMVLADTGEDAIISCKSCDYAANIEKAEVVDIEIKNDAEILPAEVKETKDIKKVEDVADFLGIPSNNHIKTLIVKYEDQIFAVMVRGDRELNLAKVKNFLDVPYIEMASEEDILRVTGGPVGFSGPKGLDIPVYADNEIKYMKNSVIGINKKDLHQINANLGRDFEVKEFSDFRNAEAGDKCPKCGGEYEIKRGIEVGHIFKLGTKYSDSMNAKYLDQNGKQKSMVMGCYGIGIGRTAAASIEQNHDEDGIIWPIQIAPFEVVVIPVNNNDDEVNSTAEKIYSELSASNVDVIIDDRKERAGFKFKDADLIGYPIRINVGKKALENGNVEIIIRKTKESILVNKEDAVQKIIEIIDNMKSE
jgi:prolyl-tRNA synthetase